MRFALLLACLLQDEGLEGARKLIEAAAAKLKAAPAIQVESESSQGEPGAAEVRPSYKSSRLIQGPDKMRWDYTGSTWSHYYVMDGKYMWDLDRLNKVFSKQRVYRGSIKAYVRDDPVLHFYLQSDPMKFLDRATDIVVSKRKEDGAEFDLISWRAPDPYGRGTQVESTLWLDAGRLPRRFTRTSDWRGRLEVQTIEYVKIDLSPKVAADAFAFKPPEGAVEKPIPGWAPDTDGTREALKLLGAVHAAFSGTEAMAYEVEMTQVIDGEKTPGARTFTTLKRSDFIRMESRGETNRHTYIIDGEIMWTVMSQGQNYTKQELMTGGHRMVSGLDPFVQVFFDGEQPLDFLSGGQDIAVVRDTLDGEACDVIEWTRPQPDYKMKYRFFIGADRRPRRMTIDSDYKGKKYLSTYSYLAFDLKPAIPKDHFTFTPGPEWTDRTNERLGEKMLAVGKVAPDFEATDPAGQAVKLSSLRGAPVVIVFGYYSHVSEIQRAQEFHDTYSKRGVVVVAVSLDFEAKAPDPKNTVRFLRVKDKTVAKTFGVDYWGGGMYLLDADGKVLAATYGNEELLKAVEAAAGPAK